MIDINSQIVLEVLTQIDAVQKIREQWRVLDASQGGSYFQSYEYFIASFEYLISFDTKPHVLVFRRGDNIIGIFPWVIRSQRHAGVPFSVVGPIHHDHTYLNDVLIDNEYQNELCLTFAAYLSQLRYNQYIFIPGTKRSAQFSNIVRPLCNKNALRSSMGHSSQIVSPFVNNELHLRSKTIKNVRRLIRKAEREGMPRFEFVRGRNITPVHYQTFLEVEASGWKGHTGTGTAIALDPVLRNYYWQLIELSGDRVQLGFYYFNDIPVAANFGCIDGNRLSLLKIGYNQDYSSLSPTHALIYQTLLNSKEADDLKVLSFVTGRSWQETWANENEELSVWLIHRSKRFVQGLQIFRKLKSFRRVR